jgi:hypothetical protein
LIRNDGVMDRRAGYTEHTVIREIVLARLH